MLHSETRQETEAERLVRLGEMTPFGSTIASYGDNVDDGVVETDQLKHTSMDDTIETTKHNGDNCSAGDDDGDHNLTDDGQYDLTNPVPTSDFSSEADVPTVDSDEDYIPDEEELKLSFRDDEHFLPKDNLVEPVDDVTIATKKTKSPKTKVEKKNKKVYQSIKDDGDDRTYQIRIRYV